MMFLGCAMLRLRRVSEIISVCIQKVVNMIFMPLTIIIMTAGR